MKKLLLAVLIALTATSVFAKGLQDERYVQGAIALTDFDGTSDLGTTLGLGGRLPMTENLDLLGGYSYFTADFDGDDSTSHTLSVGGDWNFLPKQALNPFVGASFSYATFGGDNDADNTTGWALRGGVEFDLDNNWSVAPELSYNLDEDFENGAFAYGVSANKWLTETLAVGAGVSTDEDADNFTYAVAVNMAL